MLRDLRRAPQRWQRRRAKVRSRNEGHLAQALDLSLVEAETVEVGDEEAEQGLRPCGCARLRARPRYTLQARSDRGITVVDQASQKRSRTRRGCTWFRRNSHPRVDAALTLSPNSHIYATRAGLEEDLQPHLCRENKSIAVFERLHPGKP